MTFGGAVLSLLFVNVVVSQQDAPPCGSEVDSIDCFELFDLCRPMTLVVENLPSDASGIDLTKERIQTIVESRLRAARLYTTSRLHPYLYVNINVVGAVFSIRLKYVKELLDSVTLTEGMASTWDTGGTGTHSGNAGYILQSLSEMVDKFVLEYLRVNEVAC